MIHTKSSSGYIEAIQRVQDKFGYARAVDVARELNIIPGSTCTGLKLMHKKGMIEFDMNKFVVLTKEAKKDLKRFKQYREILSEIFIEHIDECDDEILDKQIEEIYFLMNDDFMKAL